MKSDLDAKALMTRMAPATQGQIFIVGGGGGSPQAFGGRAGKGVTRKKA